MFIQENLLFIGIFAISSYWFIGVCVHMCVKKRAHESNVIMLGKKKTFIFYYRETEIINQNFIKSHQVFHSIGVRHDVRVNSYMLIVGPARARNRSLKPGELC